MTPPGFRMKTQAISPSMLHDLLNNFDARQKSVTRVLLFVFGQLTEIRPQVIFLHVYLKVKKYTANSTKNTMHVNSLTLFWMNSPYSLSQLSHLHHIPTEILKFQII